MAVIINNVFWVKIAFMVLVFFEAFLTGLVPTWSRTCRESPKILGIANSFAAGVFLAIAFVHILPEEAENWAGLKEGVDNPFPLPYFLMFCGYTLILMIDKVLFDTHSLFEDHEHGNSEGLDPAELKLQQDVKASIAIMTVAELKDPAEVKKSTAMARSDLKQSFKEYLSKEERFATRLKASMTHKKSKAEDD